MNRTKRLLAFISLVAVPLALFTLFFRYFAEIGVDWNKLNGAIDAVKNLGTILALGIGAAWAYFKFFKGRTYRPRLEPLISGQFFVDNEVPYLSITAQLKNVGLSDVKIQREGSAILVYLYKASPPVTQARDVKQEPLGAFDIFQLHLWIEPGELIKDERLIVIPSGTWVAVRLEIRIVSGGIEWNAASILERRTVGRSYSHLQLNLEETASRQLSLEAEAHER